MKNAMTAAVCVAMLVGCAVPGEREKTSPLKVLMIGNSFSESCLRETPRIAKAMGCPLDLSNLYIGGCSLKTHWDNVVAGSVIGPAFRPYRYNRWTDGVHTVSNGTANIVEALESEQWDVVVLQQASHSSWDATTYDYAITYLINLIRRKRPGAKIMLQETWSYPPWDKRLKKFGFDGPEMYRRLHAAYEKFGKMFKLEIIPVGSVAETVPDRNRLFTEPDFHFNKEGQYLQGLVWTATLFGVDVSRCPYVPAGVDPARAEVLRSAVMSASR